MTASNLESHVWSNPQHEAHARAFVESCERRSPTLGPAATRLRLARMAQGVASGRLEGEAQPDELELRMQDSLADGRMTWEDFVHACRIRAGA